MKIIDLLNKIANGEEIPKKIKVDNRFYYEYDEDIDYRSKDGTYLFDTYIQINKEDMNMEVEILEEEKKIPEKIKDKYCSQISKVELAQKYNEILDYLDYLKSKGDE